jgi:hypothetical protein
LTPSPKVGREAPAPVEDQDHEPSSISALTPAPKVVRDAPAPPEIQDHVPSSIAPLTPAPQADRDEPSVVAQQRAIMQSFDGEDVFESAQAVDSAEPASKGQIVPLPRPRIGVAGRKAAFTLRLDSQRHLRLRLACAVTGRSAQQIVAAALDAALAEIPEIEALASRVPASAGAAGAKRS